MRNLIHVILMAAAKDTPKGGSAGTATESKGPAMGAPPANKHDKDGQTSPPQNIAAGTASAPATEIDNEGVEMVRKISAATIVGKFKKPKKQDGTNPDGTPKMVAYGEEEVWPDTPLYVVMGVTHGFKTGTGDNGPYIAFLGAFEAVRYSDGKRFQGGQCFVPKAVEDMMVATLNATRKADETGSGAIEFGIEVGVKYSTTQIGYEYYVKNLVKTQGTDPLANLRSKVSAMLPKPVQARAMLPASTPPATSA